MKTEDPRTIFLKEYSAPSHWIDAVDLTIDLHATATQVTSVLCVRPNEDQSDQPLALNGEYLTLKSVRVNGEALSANQYQLSDTHLTLNDLPSEPFELETVCEIAPETNTALEGLYLSNGIFCTQCEAEGFRRITYMLDRPDVMATYRTKVIGDAEAQPVLLSNGNCVETGALENGRHFAVWEDPFPKPCYLFALVSGNLVALEDSFTTMSGRDVALKIFVEPGNVDRCDFAMKSLKASMKWDEEKFGREYDLDIFMIVAVSAFNMGAMENKGLNVFNDKYILANSDTATDLDFANIEAIVAHEYFHNWTGNRITCRDWFQLCLKEGLTVFRDQEFSADMRSRPVQRISDVRLLRSHQFPEDGGPLAHNVRPDSYLEINNFYTATVYEKGAELVRMIYRLMGADRFRKGMDVYFDQHDGRAATVEDFIDSLAQGGDFDLSQFKLWYGQAGTPEVLASGKYDAGAKSYTITLNQITQPTPGQPQKQVLHMPVEIGLIGPDGQDIALQLEGEERAGDTSRVLSFNERETTYRFVNVDQKPVPSFMRGFTAPVKLAANLNERDWAFLMAHDSDAFNRWEACQKYATAVLTNNIAALQKGESQRKGAAFADTVASLLGDASLDPEFVSQMITLPAEQTLAQTIGRNVDVDAIHTARNSLKVALSTQLWEPLLQAYHANEVTGPYSPDAEHAAKRALRTTCLSYLAASERPEALELVVNHFNTASNMTDTIGALSLLSHMDAPERKTAFDQFYDRWQDDHLVMDKWYSLQALSSLPDTLAQVIALTNHTGFSMTNPNKVRSLIGGFASANQLRFHGKDGAAYRFVADKVLELNDINPQVAARLLGAFKSWRQFEPGRQELMKTELSRICEHEGLSTDVYEIASKTLA